MSENNKNILIHAKEITFDRTEESDRQYGPFNESMTRAAIIASEMTGLKIDTEAMYKIMIALKLGRLRYNIKYDTILDSIAYLASLNELNDK